MASLLYTALLILFAVAGFLMIHVISAKETNSQVLEMPVTRWITIVGCVGIAAICVIKVLANN